MQADIESHVPSSSPSSSAASNQDTRRHAQHLRAALEELDSLHHASEDLVRRVQDLRDADDIEAKVVLASHGLAKLATVKPELFEELLDEELEKYERFIKQVKANEDVHVEILGRIEILNESFLNSRKEDPVIRERQDALQELDVSYHMYKELVENLEEGYKVRVLSCHFELAGLKFWMTVLQPAIPATLSVQRVMYHLFAATKSGA